jgi:hypothetical protein
MINHISTSSSTWLSVSNNTQKPYYINPTAISAGTVRYNHNTNCLEVYDGATWLTYGGMSTVELTPHAQTLLRWAERKMQEEQEFEALCQQHPALRDAHEKLQIVQALVKKETQP